MPVTLKDIQEREPNSLVVKELVRRMDDALLMVIDPENFPMEILIEKEIPRRVRQESEGHPPTREEIVGAMNQYHLAGWDKITYEISIKYIKFTFHDKEVTVPVNSGPVGNLFEAAGYDDDDDDLDTLYAAGII